MSKTVRTATVGIPELAITIADHNDITRTSAKAILDSLRDEIVQSVLAGKRVTLFGLGIFEVRATKAKMGRNPRTGETIQIPAGRKLVFKVAKGIKEKL